MYPCNNSIYSILFLKFHYSGVLYQMIINLAVTVAYKNRRALVTEQVASSIPGSVV